VSKAATTALAENPFWARMPSHWLKCALWAYRYTDKPVPTRDDVAAALIAAQYQHPRPVESYS
jgi:hypothetical protein